MPIKSQKILYQRMSDLLEVADIQVLSLVAHYGFVVLSFPKFLKTLTCPKGFDSVNLQGLVNTTFQLSKAW